MFCNLIDINDVNGVKVRLNIAIERALMEKFCDDDNKAVQWMLDNRVYIYFWKDYLTLIDFDSPTSIYIVSRWNSFLEKLEKLNKK